jgi:hypothetical protein
MLHLSENCSKTQAEIAGRAWHQHIWHCVPRPAVRERISSTFVREKIKPASLAYGLCPLFDIMACGSSHFVLGCPKLQKEELN